jgi:hypothetical protein
MNDDPQAIDKTLDRIRIEQWQHERTALNCGRVRNYKGQDAHQPTAAPTSTTPR